MARQDGRVARAAQNRDVGLLPGGAALILPIESMLPEGGYEVLESNQNRENSPAPFAPGIERAMRESLLRQLAFIQSNHE